MLQKLMRTDDDLGAFLARLGLGAVMLTHGAQKVFEYGIGGTVQMFQQYFHLPAAVTLLVIAVEFLGSIGLILGLLGRVAALGTAANMLGAVLLVHLQVGFFMNWSRVADRGEGYEYHILAIALALIVMVNGSGRWSVDRALSK